MLGELFPRRFFPSSLIELITTRQHVSSLFLLQNLVSPQSLYVLPQQSDNEIKKPKSKSKGKGVIHHTLE